MNQKIYSDFSKLKQILKKTNSKKIFLVTGKTSFEKSGAKNKLNKILNKNLKVKLFSEFSSNPKIKEINNGLKLFNKEKFDIIIAIGGGSAIDVAKAIKLFSKTNKPLVVLPTTAGSGSESTYFIVYYIGKEKQSKGERDVTLPNYVILDYELLKSLPNKIMASAGIDALGQAIESYWSIYSTEESKKYSKKAIKLLIKNLENAVKNRDKKSLKKIQKGANLAGKAINITKTTACHALAYPMTSYFGIPHGHAVGLTLGEMLKFNYGVSKKDCIDKRGPDYVKKMIFEISKIMRHKEPEEAGDKIYSLMENIGLEVKLSDLDLKKKDLNIIVKNGFNPERAGNNPRKLNKIGVRNILKKVY